ncbi:cobyric acid synthase [Laceyella putida]|uniref:Cobyric acid synthase n=1 Tax=Laceyella putida TaxID=110101 RepID=A0ABW2RKB8_9BACL
MKTIMIQGTASDVGKSVICTALCRYFYERGYRVAPFKSQNMSLNSYVTQAGHEIGRAQGVQAEAAGIEATYDMNPILLKPKGDMVSEVIVHGKRLADMPAMSYRARSLEEMLAPVQASLARLAEKTEVLVIEGAGSPAEINLKDRDIANMRVAELADAPVLLVADIERGGMFASCVGTFELLDEEERKRVKGWIVNKFRGSKELLEPGLTWLEERTGIPVLGVLPAIKMEVDPEDSLALTRLQSNRQTACDTINIAIIRLPYISNFTDFLPLMRQSSCSVRYVQTADQLGTPDVLILPGTKNTMHDLAWLKANGWTEAIQHAYQRGAHVVGICGGYQMLGKVLRDDGKIEGAGGAETGLGLLEVETDFVPVKETRRQAGHLLVKWANQVEVAGYEIHLGRSSRGEGESPLIRWADGTEDGAISADGRVMGTYLHGLFDNERFVQEWLQWLGQAKGMKLAWNPVLDRQQVYAGLAEWLRQHVDMERIEIIMGLK